MNTAFTQLRSLFAAVLIVSATAFATGVYQPQAANAASCTVAVATPYLYKGSVYTHATTNCSGVSGVSWVGVNVSLRKGGYAVAYNTADGTTYARAYAGRACPVGGSGQFFGDSEHQVRGPEGYRPIRYGRSYLVSLNC